MKFSPLLYVLCSIIIIAIYYNRYFPIYNVDFVNKHLNCFLTCIHYARNCIKTIGSRVGSNIVDNDVKLMYIQRILHLQTIKILHKKSNLKYNFVENTVFVRKC